jgi:hypothetical protein
MLIFKATFAYKLLALSDIHPAGHNKQIDPGREEKCPTGHSWQDIPSKLEYPDQQCDEHAAI